MQYCPNCGAELKTGANCCEYCSFPVPAPAPEELELPAPDPEIALPDPPTEVVSSSEPIVPVPTRGMKWYNFVVKIQLVLTMILNILSSFSYFRNPAEGATKFPGAIYGWLLMFYVILTYFVRRALKNYEKGAPGKLIILLSIGILLPFIYPILVSSFSGLPLSDFFSWSETIVRVLLQAAFIYANKVYFDHRAGMFVNPPPKKLIDLSFKNQ